VQNEAGSLFPRKLRQLDDIRRNPPRLVFAAQAGWRHCWQTLRDEPTFSELRTKNHRSSPKKFKKILQPRSQFVIGRSISGR
jgi:hypothetical protein